MEPPYIPQLVHQTPTLCQSLKQSPDGNTTSLESYHLCLFLGYKRVLVGETAQPPNPSLLLCHCRSKTLGCLFSLHGVRKATPTSARVPPPHGPEEEMEAQSAEAGPLSYLLVVWDRPPAPAKAWHWPQLFLLLL